MNSKTKSPLLEANERFEQERQAVGRIAFGPAETIEGARRMRDQAITSAIKRELTPEEKRRLQKESGVGDVESNARGSGARFNAGKAKVEYIPARIIADSYAKYRGIGNAVFEHAFAALDIIADFEERKIETVTEWFSIVGEEVWKMTGEQFDFGAKKYAAWNWAKGMSWSIPIACIKRHAIRLLEDELLDQESGVDHRGAIGCNMTMLAHYISYFKEGDDRPPAELFQVTDKGEVS